MRTNRCHLLFAALFTATAIYRPSPLLAQTGAFTYQGHLTADGAAFTGSAEFQPTLWTAANDGSQVAANSPPTLVVGVTNGLFVLPLDFGTSPFDAGAELWLQLEVRTAIGPFTLLSPRQRLTATPYALTARSLSGTLPAAQLSGTLALTQIPDAIVRDSEVWPLILANDGAGSGLNADLLDGFDSTRFVRTNGPVTIGGSNSTAAILTVTQSGAQNGILATTASSDIGEAAVVGRAGGTGFMFNSVAGVFGTSSTGRGVIGSSSSHDGVLGYSDSGRGVRGESSSDNGVEGYAHASSGMVYGVKGENRSSNGGAGVRGDSTFVGVWGESSGRWGVYGTSTGTSSSYGVYGTVAAGSNNYAGYFNGNVRVTGTLSKGAGSFQIDHPLDPANKYLAHSFVESPDMMNVYNGNVALDETGAARVVLPAYFEALNRDFRYQLTPVGGAAPNLHVAETVRDNAFRIAGGTPGLQVSWQITGIRQDAFANANRIVVEQDKPAEERGTYLHAEALGQPEERSLERARHMDPLAASSPNRESARR